MNKVNAFENEIFDHYRQKAKDINKAIELLREHKYLKNKLATLDEELSKKSELQEKFSREIDELSQETGELVEEIDKWQI